MSGCKLASPLGHRTQPWLSPASESSHPLRFRATQASTPDRDADCESCVAPDSPNLSNIDSIVVTVKVFFFFKTSCTPFPEKEFDNRDGSFLPELTQLAVADSK